MSGKDVVKNLQNEGWTIKRQKGSHVQMTKGARHATVPIHGNKDLPKGTLKAIEKQTGVKL
jgi:predicted RNA binding protein YcfA (HicA-like mRNA interferase family)